MLFRCLPLLWVLTWVGPVLSQSEVAATPTVGLRDNAPRDFALQNATVVVAPGQIIEQATVLIHGPSITAVGAAVDVPAGYRTIDCTGKTIYAGLIDAYSEVDVPVPALGAGYWNPNVTPHRNTASAANQPLAEVEKLRSQGLTVRLVAPRGGIVKGSSSIILLGGDSAGRTLLSESVWHHLQLTVPRGSSRSQYPNSPMGAVALLRQSMYDAKWYRDAWTAYRADRSLPRPETNVALDQLSNAVRDQTFVIDAPNERMAIRAASIADEFSLPLILRGSGREYRRLDEIAALNRPVLVPVDFPSTPEVGDRQRGSETTLQELMHWDLAPRNPAMLVDSGVTICLTTDGLEKPNTFLAAIRKAVTHGLPPQAALAAVTTTPARLMNIDDQVGRVQPGMLANLILCDGDLFDEPTKLLETWVAGEQFVIEPDTKTALDRWVGTWSCQADSLSFTLELSVKGDKLKGVARAPSDRAPSDADDANADDAEVSTPLKGIQTTRDRLNANVDLRKIDASQAAGLAQLSVRSVTVDDRVDHFGSIVMPNGETRAMELIAVDPPPPDQKSDETPPEQNDTEQNDTEQNDTEQNDTEQNDTEQNDTEQNDTEQNDTEQNDSEQDNTEQDNTEQDNTEQDNTEQDNTEQDNTEQSDTEQSDADPTNPEQIDADPPDEPTPILFPLGGYGLQQPITEQPTVMFRGATVWTCEESGVLEQTDVLIRDGLIADIGQRLPIPENCQIIDARGKHITPGIIDCHSHIATDGGVNESAQAVTAEVRVGDFIDNSSISIYRQLAGGTTTANILHGSANPIGGQNQVIKFRWGGSMDDMRMKQAPAGIKFALGENVKRNQSRYPNTRMGVEQIIRDQFLAAREYSRQWKQWNAGQRNFLPPRRDLQLDAIVEIQNGERWIHCHSYRQDEIIATLDVLEEFGVQIGTLQHVLEGYKVADRMARHGAMGSSFSDWWAYKFEVFDAIPYNGALMHQQGVVVSFNSDDAELGRRLNTEAAKATKYGAVPEEQALKFVTLNPAKQLRIDQYVGSLKVGKHADLVLWSGRPLSTMSRCEQTWIDGQQYFSIQSDLEMRERDSQLRATLIQKALGSDQKPKPTSDDKVDEEDRWLRHDIYCSAHGDTEYDHRRRK